MTIAACYLSLEGVVLGADSTSTYQGEGGHHYYNHAQKLFEIGDSGTLGVVTWGLGGLNTSSYRHLFAILSDDLVASPASTVQEVAVRWCTLFSAEYANSGLIQEYNRLDALTPYVAGATAPGARNGQEEELYVQLQSSLSVGFCIAGRVGADRTPGASFMVFNFNNQSPTPTPLQPSFYFWGAPNMVKRILWGCDDQLQAKILMSGKWTGSAPELEALVQEQFLAHPVIPIRDAIDFVNFCIFSTIKAYKFSNFSQICGGPIEVAVITADRGFRWVKHKSWESAIKEGDC